MKTWCLSHSKEGTSVALTEVPFWAWAAQYLGEEICWLSEKLTGVCLIAPPDWLYALRWGPADEDGFTERSVGSKMFGFGQRLCSGFRAYRHEKLVAQLPVSYDWVREHEPDVGWPWDGSDPAPEDDERST